MTTEQPTRPARPPRPGPAFRRAALGLPPDPASAATGASPRTAPRRESLREALARIPDLERDPVSTDVRGPSVPVDGDPSRRARVVRPGVAAERAGGDGSAPRRRRPAPDEVDADVDVDGVDDGTPGPGGGLRARASRLLNGPIPAGAEIAESPEAGDGLPATANGRSRARGATDAPSEPVTIDETDVDRVVDTSEVLVPAPVEARLASPVADPPPWLLEAAEEEARSRRTPPAPVPTWRRAAFGLTVFVLIAAIPVLGRTGYRLVSESTDGTFNTSIKSPTDPGYEQEVSSTPTQLLLHKDAEGRPVAATVLSLSGAEGGGAVIFVPLDTEVRTPAFGVDRIVRAYDVLSDTPQEGIKQFAVQVASVLNVGIDSVVEVDDRGWAQLVGPVAPLTLDNPDPIEVDGETIPSGEIELTADQVGPYLSATRDGETAFNALVRHELVWDAWLDAVAESGRDDVVPGESTSGIGLFARELAAGPVTFSVVPTTPDPEIEGLLRVEGNALAEILLAAVPSPDPALPGSRPTVRLLNGVSAEAIPGEIIQKVVQIGGSVAVIGNGPSFGRDETTIVYSDPVTKDYAELLQAALGGGSIRLDPEAEDSVAMTVILGRDVVDEASSTTTTNLDTESGGS